MFSVNVLTYGNYPGLTSRCLASILRAHTSKLVSDVRIGMNEVSDKTRQVVEAFASHISVPCYLYESEDKRNVLKYPLMRRMLYDYERPITANRIMWFDDDSFINYEKMEDWFPLVDSVWRDGKTIAMGSTYDIKYSWTPPEVAAIKSQPWYGGVDPLKSRPQFLQGGWWVVDLEFLSKWDYPCRELRHNGGDVLLGEIFRQQKVPLKRFRTGVAINANEGGRESESKRRGVTTPRPYATHPHYNYDHHDFVVTVTPFIKG